MAIAKLPLTGPATTLWEGLREDGSPPLYYLLLHGWIELFGTGTAVVRALSAVLNLAAIYPLYVLALRVVGQAPRARGRTSSTSARRTRSTTRPRRACTAWSSC